jgi:hypothetical protein
MRPIFLMSLACAVMSLLATFGFSAMSVVPGSSADRLRDPELIAAGAFAVGWLAVAFWARPRQRAAAPSLPPPWLRRVVIGVSVVYLLGVFLLAFG